MKSFSWSSFTPPNPLCVMDFGLRIKGVQTAFITSHDSLQEAETFSLKPVQIFLGDLHPEGFLVIAEYPWHKLGTDMSESQVLPQNSLHCCSWHSCGGGKISDGLPAILLELLIHLLDVGLGAASARSSCMLLIFGRCVKVPCPESFVPHSNLSLSKSPVSVNSFETTPALNGCVPLGTKKLDN